VREVGVSACYGMLCQPERMQTQAVTRTIRDNTTVMGLCTRSSSIVPRRECRQYAANAPAQDPPRRKCKSFFPPPLLGVIAPLRPLHAARLPPAAAPASAGAALQEAKIELKSALAPRYVQRTARALYPTEPQEETAILCTAA